ncbi:MAG: aminotransferase class IV, partial [Acidaminococcaceae bacterium]|nr:aminotransferase class IV [Acidaminococcaceae bacterium]
EDERWANCDVNTLNRMPEVLAKEKAVVGKYFDALFIRNGKITETTESAFYVYKDGILWTHPSNKYIHRNVTSRLLKERLGKDLDLQVMERAFDKEFALGAEGAFICGPRVEFAPVVKIDRDQINGGKVHPVVGQIQEAFFDFVLKECP